MEEILDHLGCITPCKWWDKLPINWCKISSINSIIEVCQFWSCFFFLHTFIQRPRADSGFINFLSGSFSLANSEKDHISRWFIAMSRTTLKVRWVKADSSHYDYFREILVGNLGFCFLNLILYGFHHGKIIIIFWESKSRKESHQRVANPSNMRVQVWV